MQLLESTDERFARLLALYESSIGMKDFSSIHDTPQEKQMVELCYQAARNALVAYVNDLRKDQ
jgi:hypothetical protein